MDNGFEPAGSWPAIRASRPTRDLVLALVYVISGLLAVFAAIIPPSDMAPTRILAGVGLVSIIAGAILFLPRRPSSDRVLRIYLVAGIIGISILVASVKSELGTAIAAVPYIWFSVYFGAYVEPRQARMLVVLLCASFGLALTISDVPATASLWVIFSATVVITTEALLVSNNALRVQARQDPLTGLLNRHGLEESIGPILAIGERIGKPTSLALIDLDDFKEVNDSQGHLAGDRVLVELARSWTANKRDADLLVRFGGDEFILVMPATSREQATALIERLGSASLVPWSYGVVEVESGEAISSAVDRADQALYASKPGGTGRPAAVLRES